MSTEKLKADLDESAVALYKARLALKNGDVGAVQTHLLTLIRMAGSAHRHASKQKAKAE